MAFYKSAAEPSILNTRVEMQNRPPNSVGSLRGAFFVKLTAGICTDNSLYSTRLKNWSEHRSGYFIMYWPSPCQYANEDLPRARTFRRWRTGCCKLRGSINSNNIITKTTGICLQPVAPYLRPITLSATCSMTCVAQWLIMSTVNLICSQLEFENLCSP
jgi:hypothetical protein